MLPLSATSDNTLRQNFTITNEYYDWDSTFKDPELWGSDALNQSIEIVLTTEPGERLFNVNFGSPLYSILFENTPYVPSMMEGVFDVIEYWVPIKIDRQNTDIQIDPDNNSISFKIPYVSNNGTITGYFSRRIYK